MKSLALSFSAALLALFTLAPTSSAQRSVQVGAGYNSRTSQLDFGVQFSNGYNRGRAGQRANRGRFDNYRRVSAPRKVYVPGRFEIVQKKVWVPGAVRQQWTPAQYDTRYDFCGNPYQVLVRAGFYHTIQEPGCYEFRNERVWVAAHWVRR